MFKDYYQLLHIAREASGEEVRKAYREMALKYHPDQNQDPAAHLLFIEIKEAYETLSDPAARTRYNSLYDRHYQTGKSTYVHVRSRGGGGYGRSKHRGRRYNRSTPPPANPIAREQRKTRPASFGDEYIFSAKDQERQAEVLGSRIGYTYYAMVVRLAAALTLLLSLGLAADYFLATKSEPLEIKQVTELPWSLSEPGILRVQTAGATVLVLRSYWQYMRVGASVQFDTTPMGGYVTRVYVSDRQGNALVFRPFGGLYGATFVLVIILMLLSLTTLLTRENEELASYVGTVNLLLFFIIFGIIKNA